MRKRKRSGWYPALLSSITLLGILAAISFVSKTSAYLTDQKSLNSRMMTAGNKTKIEEDFPSPSPAEPGKVVTKKVQIRNTGETTCYIRVRVSFSEEGKAELYETDTVNWIRKKDGFYYYIKSVAPGQQTTPLFQGVLVKEAVQTHEILVTVYEESVEAKKGSEVFADYEAAWKYYEGGGDS